MRKLLLTHAHSTRTHTHTPRNKKVEALFGIEFKRKPTIYPFNSCIITRVQNTCIKKKKNRKACVSCWSQAGSIQCIYSAIPIDSALLGAYMSLCLHISPDGNVDATFKATAAACSLVAPPSLATPKVNQ